jgi:transposase
MGETVEYNKDNPDSRSFLAFAGLDPKVRASGKWAGKMKMTKRGSPYLRYAINTAAFYAAFHEPMFMKVYKKQVGRGKPGGLALAYVAKKMAYVMAAILRTNEPFVSKDVDEGQEIPVTLSA